MQSPSTPHLQRRLTYRVAGEPVARKYPVTVAIDFGTTFSGCSYKFEDDDEIYDVVKWPKHFGFYAKVPSLLYYKGRANRLVDWGDGARRLALQPGQDGTLIRQFKLWLAKNTTPPPPLLDGQEPVVAISDFLRLFHESVLEQMMRTGAGRYSVDQFGYCLTVPAIWDDTAKATMREAMVQAGIIRADDPPERLVLVGEPEAAAMYIEKQCESWNDMQDQDTFMIVDAGGGTVDIIIYQIDKSGETRSLKEITRGSGGTCGSAYIDNNMRQWLLDRLGSYAEHVSTCTLENIMESFVEKIKPYFCGEGDQYLTVPATMMQLRQHIDDLIDEDGNILLSAAELDSKIYVPVFDQVISLIQEQLDQAPQVNSLYLVGGFGCSEYLYTTVKQRFEPRIPTVAMAPRGDVAVARGAIYHISQPAFIATKILRNTYGLMTRMAFQEGLDPESSAVITSDGIKRCSTRFDIMAFKGQSIHVNQKISRHFWVKYPRNTEADLYVYDGDAPIPRQVTDPGVRKMADFPIRMPPLEGYSVGDPVDIKIDFMFGLAELKVHVFIVGRQIEFVTAFENE
ncbi:hypothetical protein BDB00DRAFT_837393 [Zychaea mexicana]|uniref:uncharacterized protein n=1 Tax=Zychaea mexicana TaxID=64656 RepID=UPI0022FDC939|nr:uncharacterized protein BDB00DRAFT_837393 [Zychaea mexicana]KAI9490489.1 hypothetical protein BDB00DRAFT_837393 [Zychaea mexicana]